MANKLVFTVLFVTLSWMSMTTYGQNATTPATNMTAMPNNMTTMAPNMTAMAPNMTAMAPNMTAMAPSNMTTMAPSNMTTMAPNMTTMAPNMTTMAPSNMTTMPNNMTVAPTTTAPPLTPNITVVTLDTPINRSECGITQLCGAEPSNCSPDSENSCLFIAAQQISGNNFAFGLSGQSDGYLAATLSDDETVGNNDTTYVCANNNGAVRFFSTLFNNGQLVQTVLNVNSVKGSVNNGKIQCTFAATVPSLRVRGPGFALSISTGSFNSTSGALGTPNTRFRSPVVDLANPNTTIINQISSNNVSTTEAPSSSHSVTFQQTLSQALLISVMGIVGLAMV